MSDEIKRQRLTAEMVEKLEANLGKQTKAPKATPAYKPKKSDD